MHITDSLSYTQVEILICLSMDSDSRTPRKTLVIVIVSFQYGMYLVDGTQAFFSAVYVINTLPIHDSL